MKALSLGPEELLMVDDLKPGKDMADACGVPFAAACWAHHIPSILQYMKENCSCCLSSSPRVKRSWASRFMQSLKSSLTFLSVRKKESMR